MSSPLPILKSSGPAALELDPRTFDRALSCVHCGLCLPVCPTYTTTHHEADSPRGRIQLMRALAEGTIEPTTSVVKHLDLCLDCRACETACPSGVVYHELIEETRARMDGDLGQTSQRDAKPAGGLLRWVFLNIFTQPARLKLALLPVRLLQKLGIYWLLRSSGVLKLLPAQWRKMEQMLPPSGALWPRKLPQHVAAAGGNGSGAPGKRVAFVTGCVGSVMFERVNRMAVELLSLAGCEVVVPRSQACCGAIHHHNGQWKHAMELGRRNIDALLPREAPVDYVTTAIAGCGAMLREYDHMLRDDGGYAARGQEFSSRVRDISEVLAEVGIEKLLKHPVQATVTYHDACHLAHAQQVTSTPRELLAMIPGLKIEALPESDMCCGAAGTYNLTQPQMATELAGRKLGHIASTGATIVVTGNVGCAMHIESEARARGQKIEVVHPVELLYRSVTGKA